MYGENDDRAVFRWRLKSKLTFTLTVWSGLASNHPKHPQWTKGPDHAGGIERGLWDQVDDEFHVCDGTEAVVYFRPRSFFAEYLDSLSNIMTNEQKKDWFLRLNPNGIKPSPPLPLSVSSREALHHLNSKMSFAEPALLGRIPVLVDHNQSPPYPVMETSAELLYLLKFYDPNDEFGFKDELERSDALQWLFFWHGSGAPYFGQLGHFARYAKEKIPCMTYFFFLFVFSP